ncbi:hypothetical protein M419DRAFT_125707 [Trichoderma reesei RUT C-30]|uniref:Uncharacterized protein n=1 Tax=Hypocrea jecorina (strain ATCC 56765 / BCRC 32924 / NRRL 11460 / Rut C-30) TaxID=1344414 RepID=A0A024SKE2_HYPJR|nr:hypothetical protein M419DRAFT_125707 [Trichoderma reesei RUT C-30]
MVGMLPEPIPPSTWGTCSLQPVLHPNQLYSTSHRQCHNLTASKDVTAAFISLSHPGRSNVKRKSLQLSNVKFTARQ